MPRQNRKLPLRILRACGTLFVVFGLLFSSGEGIQLLPFPTAQLNIHSASSTTFSVREGVAVRADEAQRPAWITKTSKHDSWQHFTGTGQWHPDVQLTLVFATADLSRAEPSIPRVVQSGPSGSRAPPEYLSL